MTRYSTETPATAAAPPTADPPPVARQSTWPTVLSVLAIIWAVLCYLGACVNVATPWVMPAFIELAGRSAPQSQVELLEASIPPAGWAIITGLVSLALATLLTVGAVRLQKRRRSASGLCNLWSVLSIVWVFVGIAVNILLSVGRSDEDLLESPMVLGWVLGACTGVLIGCALPVFMLIWLNRRVIREEMAEWRE